ncbi:MAG: hypothetical protein CO189_01720 [candidate division Zixibacteria bacterium CG_4_9_14_3_um_filter_46_8]|nr:MAG: hypothetical protein CO189_01720 [candidate division Zixibacteria bacterium CG_4_9_14_3_um_filter_46_8]
MDIGTITATYNGLKKVKDIIKGLADLKLETTTMARINMAEKEVAEALDSIFQLREELFRLQSENNDLRQSIKERDDWDKRLEDYELVETDGGAIVYQSKSGLKHFLCPGCIEKKEAHILQDCRDTAGGFHCPGCHYSFNIKRPMGPIPPVFR